MSTENEAGRHRVPKPAPAPRTHNRWVRGLVATLSLGIMGATAASGSVVAELNRNIVVIDAGDAIPEPTQRAVQAPTDTSPLNLLLMGSDTRVGQGKGFGKAGGARSDTTLLVHLYEGRTKALVVSIPRDTLVTIPPCKGPEGQQYGTWTTKFNAAFAIGGPACTIKTIKAETGISIDSFVVVDFKGFERVVNTLGGVDVCLTSPAYDPKTNGSGGSGLNLPAGWSHISGKQALAFVRARETLGDGSDLSRIQRQQEFLSSMLRSIEGSGLLTSPTKVLEVLNNITSSISVSKDLATVKDLADLALSMSKLKPANINFITTPYTLKGDGNVHWTAETEKVWKAIRSDKPYAKAEAAAPAPNSSASSVPTAEQLVVPPSQIHVTVLNATRDKTLGNTVAKALRKQGFKVDKVGTAPKRTGTTKVRYNKAWLGAAQTLAYAVNTSVFIENNSLSKSITLVIGGDYTSVRKVVLTTKQSPTWSTSVNAGTVQCTAGNNKYKK